MRSRRVWAKHTEMRAKMILNKWNEMRKRGTLLRKKLKGWFIPIIIFISMFAFSISVEVFRNVSVIQFVFFICLACIFYYKHVYELICLPSPINKKEKIKEAIEIYSQAW